MQFWSAAFSALSPSALWAYLWFGLGHVRCGWPAMEHLAGWSLASAKCRQAGMDLGEGTAGRIYKREALYTVSAVKHMYINEPH